VVIDQLPSWLDESLTVPELPLSKAIAWVNNGWRLFTRFLDDPRIPLGNGIVEQAVRGVVLGRKVHAGSRFQDGTRVAALVYSLVESCRLEGVNARAYMIEAARRALEDGESVFLPEDFARLDQSLRD
jgi:hypothetical protein